MASRIGRGAPRGSARATRLPRRPPKLSLHGETNNSERAKSIAPEIGEKIEYPCYVCEGGNADATYLIDAGTGRPSWSIRCFTASCESRGGAYLCDLGEALGLGRGATKDELVAELRRRS